MEVRFFNSNETNQLQQGIHDIWAKDHILAREEKLLNYMFFENPSKPILVDDHHYSFLGAWRNDSLIGVLGVMPFTVNILGRKRTGCSLANWGVLPEERNSGAGLALMQQVHKLNPSIILALGINQNVGKLYNAMKWNVLNDVPRWIGIVNKKKSVDMMFGGDYNPLRYWDEVRTVQTNPNYLVKEVDSLEEEKWNRFYWINIATQSLGFARDYSFLSWRYLNHPYFNYKVITCSDLNGNYKGLAIVRIETIVNGEKIGRIVEFISSDQDSAICLANALIQIDKEIIFFDFFCFSNRNSWGLETIGFKRVLNNITDNMVVPFRFQPIDVHVTNLMASMYVTPDLSKEINIIKENIWYVTKGDGDQDRPN